MTPAGTPIGIFRPTLHCVGCLSTASGRESLGTAEVELSSPSATPGLRCFTHPYLSCYKKEAPRENGRCVLPQIWLLLRGRAPHQQQGGRVGGLRGPVTPLARRGDATGRSHWRGPHGPRTVRTLGTGPIGPRTPRSGPGFSNLGQLSVSRCDEALLRQRKADLSLLPAVGVPSAHAAHTSAFLFAPTTFPCYRSVLSYMCFVLSSTV
jgi:hypothetical protein